MLLTRPELLFLWYKLFHIMLWFFYTNTIQGTWELKNVLLSPDVTQWQIKKIQTAQYKTISKPQIMTAKSDAIVNSAIVPKRLVTRTPWRLISTVNLTEEKKQSKLFAALSFYSCFFLKNELGIYYLCFRRFLSAQNSCRICMFCYFVLTYFF